MKTKTIIKVVSVLIVLGLIISLNLINKYLNIVQYYEPINISVYGLNRERCRQLKFYGISPLGKKTEIPYFENKNKWYYPYAFHKEIDVFLKDTDILYNKIIDIRVGKLQTSLQLKQLEKIYLSESGKEYRFSSIINSNKSKAKMLVSVFRWHQAQKLVFFFLEIIALIVLIINLKKIVKIIYSISYILTRYCKHRGSTVKRHSIKIYNSVSKGVKIFRNRISNYIFSGIFKLLNFFCILIRITKSRICSFYHYVLKVRKFLLQFLCIFLLQSILFVYIIVCISLIFNDLLLKMFEKSNSILFTIIFIFYIGSSISACSYAIMQKCNIYKPLIINVILLNSVLCFTWIMTEIGLRFLKINQVYTESTGDNRYFTLYSAPPSFQSLLHPQNTKYTDRKNEFSYSYQTNEFGLIKNEKNRIICQKDVPRIKILALGDSFTQGVGAASDSSWPCLLEEKLNLGKGNHYEVYNAGKMGFDPFYSYYLYHKMLLNFRPNIILLAVNSTDLLEVSVRGGFERFKNNGHLVYKNGSRIEWLFAISYLTRLILINGLKYDYQLKPTQDKYAMFNYSISVLGKCFYKFKSEEKIYNYTFIPVFHPTKNDFWDNGFSTNSLHYWYVNNISTSAINLYEFFVKKESINTKNLLNYYWLLDGHNNAKGYAAFTRGVEWKLKEMRIVK